MLHAWQMLQHIYTSTAWHMFQHCMLQGMCTFYRLYDLPNSELMKYWDKTYTFLKEAK